MTRAETAQPKTHITDWATEAQAVTKLYQRLHSQRAAPGHVHFVKHSAGKWEENWARNKEERKGGKREKQILTDQCKKFML